MTDKPVHGAILWLAEYIRELERLTAALADRCHKQSELLSKHAEKQA